MRYLAVVIIGFSLVAGTQTALAGGHGGHYGHGGYGGHYYGSHHGHHSHHHSDAAAYLIGGLALGALFTSAYYHTPRYVETGYYETRRVVHSYPRERVIYSSTQSAAPVVITGRRLLRDLEGRCWEKQTDAQGEDLRTELPAEECNW